MCIKKLTLLTLFFVLINPYICDAKIIYLYRATKKTETANKDIHYEKSKIKYKLKSESVDIAKKENNIQNKYYDNDYKLNIGDKIKITIFEEKNLSGYYEIDSQGNINMPLIGTVYSNNKTVKELEKEIKLKYKDGYLVNPIINIEILNVQPFFIIGEVNRPGSYSYKNGMTVLNAIATAGGYTYRANKNKIYIERKKNNEKVKIRAKDNNAVLPGDIIIIKERFF